MLEGNGGAVFPYCHCYLYDGDELIAFDPQCGKVRLAQGLTYLEKTYSDIDYIINSHFHLDHIGSNAFLKHKSNAQLLIHEADRCALEKLDSYVERYGMDKDLEQEWRATLRRIGYKEVIPDQTFSDGDILPGGFQVIHTPGHAPGHCCFYKSEVLISGDMDLTSPWLGNISCNVADYLNSLEKLKKLKLKLILPAHGQPISVNIPEKLEAFHQRFIKREEKIYQLLPTRPISLSDIAKRLFQTFSKTQRTRQAFFTFHFGKIACLNFLIHLEVLGKVQRIVKNGQELWQKIS
ncbi:MAG: MBL fold metallo-hydrolase [Candidatus Helarchaeota archaeon]